MHEFFSLKPWVKSLGHIGHRIGCGQSLAHVVNGCDFGGQCDKVLFCHVIAFRYQNQAPGHSGVWRWQRARRLMRRAAANVWFRYARFPCTLPHIVCRLFLALPQAGGERCGCMPLWSRRTLAEARRGVQAAPSAGAQCAGSGHQAVGRKDNPRKSFRRPDAALRRSQVISMQFLTGVLTDLAKGRPGCALHFAATLAGHGGH